MAEPTHTQRERTHGARWAAIGLPCAVAAACVAVPFGLPAWIASPLAIILGVVASVAVVRALDERDARERERLGQLWGLLAPDSGAAGHDGDAASLASMIAGQRAADRDRAEQIEAVVNAIDVPTIALDPAGRIILANPAASSLIGRALLGRDIEDAFTQPDLVALATGARRGTPRLGRVRLVRPGSTLLLEVSAAPIRTSTRSVASEADGRPARFGVVLTLRDVTELAAAAQLKTDFVANASHELRTPLASIRAAVETIQDHGGDDPEMRERFLRTIARAASRLEDLCRDLLDLSRVETTESSVERRDVAISEICEELADVFRPVCEERRLEIRAEIDPASSIVRSDPRLLHVILKNLIENATKFAIEGTTIRVVAAPIRTEDDRVDRRSLRLEVIDQGIGIPIALQARIFERFFQADPARAGATTTRGTGLGLAIVKHAVRALGGKITVHSVWKQGTTMRVELPDAVHGAPEASGLPDAVER